MITDWVPAAAAVAGFVGGGMLVVRRRKPRCVCKHLVTFHENNGTGRCRWRRYNTCPCQFYLDREHRPAPATFEENEADPGLGVHAIHLPDPRADAARRW